MLPGLFSDLWDNMNFSGNKKPAGAGGVLLDSPILSFYSKHLLNKKILIYFDYDYQTSNLVLFFVDNFQLHKHQQFRPKQQ
jgi:hypothetical protein